MTLDVIVIGGGQSGLALGYYLRRSGLSFVILDDQKNCGGAWLHTWKSLRLFSPAQWSSLPGMIMKGGTDYYPSRDETIEYLCEYEKKYNLPVQRNVMVTSVSSMADGFQLDTSAGRFIAKAVVSATGSFRNPYIPVSPGEHSFTGIRIHSSQYTSPEVFSGKRVAIIGEGNSGAQILAEVSRVAAGTIWITQKEPRFLPDEIDGRYLFDAATQMYEAQKAGKDYNPPSLGDIVMVESVKEARNRGVLTSVRPFDRFNNNTLIWADGREEKIDAVIYCTGYKPALSHLAPLNIIEGNARPETSGTRSKKIEGLWLVGYGSWTGFASATLVGVGRSAKATCDEVVNYVKKNDG